MKNNKTSLILLFVIILAGIIYLAINKSNSTTNTNQNNTQDNQKAEPTNTKILELLTSDWQNIQKSIGLHPSFHNQEADKSSAWRSPLAVQFIDKNKLIVRTEDDNDTHIVIFSFNNNEFAVLEVFQSTSDFTLANWQNLVNEHGNTNYSVATYSAEVMRNGDLVLFDDLTLIPENVFLKNYWENN